MTLKGQKKIGTKNKGCFFPGFEKQNETEQIQKQNDTIKIKGQEMKRNETKNFEKRNDI
jgi:hypothetical protein